MTIKNHLTPIQKKDFSKLSRKDESVLVNLTAKMQRAQRCFNPFSNASLAHYANSQLPPLEGDQGGGQIKFQCLTQISRIYANKLW
jgi:hypothetical protein